jgi:hypothetical protein
MSDALIKNVEEDMILPCTLAILDKNTCNFGGGGRLLLEPIVMSYELMKHDVRKTPLAMCVLGFINTSPILLRGCEPLNAATAGTGFSRPPLEKNQKSNIPGSSVHRPEMEPDVPWQIVSVILHLFVPFIIGDTEGHDALYGHYKSCTARVAQLCQACECPNMVSGY